MARDLEVFCDHGHRPMTLAHFRLTEDRASRGSSGLFIPGGLGVFTRWVGPPGDRREPDHPHKARRVNTTDGQAMRVECPQCGVSIIAESQIRVRMEAIPMHGAARVGVSDLLPL